MAKELQTWRIRLNGKTVEKIHAEALSLKDGFAVFWTQGEQVAITALGGGAVLVPGSDSEDYVDPDVLAL